jgi:XTP/dITP diphosphohydrolase
MENAMKKAIQTAQALGLPALADDSGLEVDALDGRPGVWSARYAGEGASDPSNNMKLLEEMKGVEPERRTARFRCVMVAASPDGRTISAEGSCEGMIAEEMSGEGGFGYDPLFFVPELGRTMAQLSRDEKNSISHRGKAVSEIMKQLPAFLEEVS